MVALVCLLCEKLVWWFRVLCIRCVHVLVRGFCLRVCEFTCVVRVSEVGNCTREGVVVVGERLLQWSFCLSVLVFGFS